MKRGARTEGGVRTLKPQVGRVGRCAHLDFVGKVRARRRDLNEIHVAGEQRRRPASSSQDIYVIDT